MLPEATYGVSHQNILFDQDMIRRTRLRNILRFRGQMSYPSPSFLVRLTD